MRLVHQHLRGRQASAPAKNIYLRMLDVLVYAAGILGPLATIPQVIQIYVTHDASGVSVLTWGMYALFDPPWILYAYVYRERPLFVCYVLWFLFNSSVAIGAVIYGH